MKDDTIVAISTALGKGAISIVRMSGSEAITITNSLFTGKDLENVDSHTIHYGFIKEQEEVIDEVLITVMKAPKTFTTEDIIEINCHGGIISTNRILEALLNKGARLAEPGEFTKRAFLNGRIDLSQAEAVMDLIESKTDVARRQALGQLDGNLSSLIKNFRERIKNLLSSIEVNIDYPEYYDIEVVTIDKVKSELDLMKKELKVLVEEAKNATLIKEGIKTVIVGRPNVGKSSILNRLLGQEKAIVTDIEGTTRDIVEGEINLDGIVLNIMDTAGIRETTDTIEKIGVEKSLELINDAQLVLLVLNSSEELTTRDRDLLEMVNPENTIVILNKNDLKQKIDKDMLEGYHVISTNTNSVEGIVTLKDKIKELFKLEKIESKEETYLTNARQTSLAKQAYQALIDAEKGIEEDLPIDMVSIDLKSAFDLLGEIIGETYDEEIIDHLFANFCVGK